jgi:soluble cytochrome b562
VTALVRGLALGVSPDEPEAEHYQHGDEVVVGTPYGDIDVTVVEHGDDGWV